MPCLVVSCVDFQPGLRTIGGPAFAFVPASPSVHALHHAASPSFLSLLFLRARLKVPGPPDRSRPSIPAQPQLKSQDATWTRCLGPTQRYTFLLDSHDISVGHFLPPLRFYLQPPAMSESSMASAISLADEIDGLLARYLHLLDVYTQLKQDLSTLQASVGRSQRRRCIATSRTNLVVQVHQHLARANFSAERGIRYGQDLYDERMQASRLCSITPTASAVDFAVCQPPRGPQTEANPADIDGDAPLPNRKKDPIRMFGILTPQSLRVAQSDAIKAVEDIIPKLLSTDAEMKEVEIKIRRGRKRKAKAEAAEAKQTMEEQRAPLMT
ncbi:hypothetical protein BP5796_09994 [Coleophoma crateriformis]|uniref:Vacuolar ATPase assembly protein VMA22 n=1 Tax=Coleophoma crateriformis TaxID=565419 RepID=A0A3D8QU67_9HELO|nr:hypothetical protein BP5796_09994 [Coleophoma crateriformis]